MASSVPHLGTKSALWLIVAAIALFALALTVGHGQALHPAAPADYAFPTLTGRVVDQADLLPAADETKLAARSAALEQRTGHQFVVATVNSLGGHSVDDYPLRLANYWQIGRKGINDGVVMLVAPHERKVRIEVGYGIEATLTNAEAAHIIAAVVLPDFKQGEMARGIEQGAAAIVADLLGTSS